MTVDRNLLILLTGGMRSDVFSHVAAWPVNTPHFDDLATWGVGLAATAVSPAAGPANLSMWTGLHPRQHGLLDEGPLLTGRRTWAHQLAEAGYHVVGVGQIDGIAEACAERCPVGHLSSLNDEDCAYLQHMHRRGLLDRVQQQRSRRLESGPFEMDAFGLTGPGDDVDVFIAQQASLAIETLPRDKPWALIVSFTGPGNDLPAPDRFLKQIDTAALHRAFAPANLATIDTYAEIPYPRTLIQQLNGERVAAIRQHYLARVSLLDEGLGLMRSTLDRCEQAERTWISLCSDRGQLLGERGLIGHRSLLGPAVSVPLWLLPPEMMDLPIRQHREFDVPHRLVSPVDLAATVCAIAGADPPPGCVGESILPAIHQREVGRDRVLCEYGTRLMLETMSHRIIYDVESQQPRALFDLVRDPQERDDLVDTTTALGVLDMLQWELAAALLPLRPVAA